MRTLSDLCLDSRVSGGFHKLKLTTVSVIVMLRGGGGGGERGSQVMTLYFIYMFESFGSKVIFKASFS